jgi:peptide/nickel transport system substrate-binding protein
MTNKILMRMISMSMCLTIFLSGCDYMDTLKVQEATFVGKTVASPDCTYGGEISSVHAVDAYTVSFTLCQPDAAFPAKIASPIFAVQDESVLAATGGDSNLLSGTPVGTGAYRLTSWEKEVMISLEPSTSYWGSPGLPESIEFLWRGDPGQRYGFVSYTTVDGLDIPPASLIAAIKSNSSLRAVQHPLANLYYIGFNNTLAPMDNVEVRRAIALALDRPTIVQQTFPLGSELAQQIVPASIHPGHTDTLSWYSQNPLEAASLLRSAGFDFATPITLAVANSNMGYLESAGRIATLVAAQLEAIGVKVTIKPMSLDELKQNIEAGTEMAYINWFQADYNDGSAFFEAPFVYNSAQFGNASPDIQQEVKNSLSSSDTNVRQESFDRLNTLVKDQVPLIPLGYAANISVFRSSVNNVAVNAYYENFEDMTGFDPTIQYYGVTEPLSIWPADEDDYQTFRITRLLYDTLLAPGFSSAEFEPLLAESWESNSDLTQWTFHLRYNVRFSNNTSFDANDVVASFAAIWDAGNVNHKGRTGEFAYYKRLFGNLLNE